MGIARSSFYDLPTAVHDDTAIVEAIAAICDEFEFYGWRRVRAELRHRGMIVNHKKVRRLMREHDLQPRRRRRHVATTDSNHDQPIYPNRTRELTVDGPNQPTSHKIFRDLSTRSTMPAVSTPLWAM
jgi:putative transposase